MRLYFWKEGRAIDEEQVVMRIRAGDADAFRLLMEGYRQHIFQIAYSVVRNRADAEDIVQEAFIQIHRALPQYEMKGLKAWISRITINKAIDYKRKKARRPELVSQLATHDGALRADHESVDSAHPYEQNSRDALAEVLDIERKEQLAAELDRIPPLHREMVQAFYLEDKSYDQIASEQHITPKTVESRLYRARQWLRNHWKEEDWR